MGYSNMIRQVSYYQPSDDIAATNVPSASTNSATYVKVKEIILGSDIDPTSKFRFKFALCGQNANPATFYGRVYRNGVAIGSEYSSATTTPTDVTPEDINATNWKAGDALQIYAHGAGGLSAYVSNFRLCGFASSWKVTV